MATYQKRGYKKSVEFDTEVIEEQPVNVEDSTTAEIFDTLEETANKSEKWIEKNSKVLLISLIVAVVIIFGYMGYNQFIKEPAEKNAANALVFAKKEFQNATTTKKEEDFNLALNGNDEQEGLLEIVKEYSTTRAGNLAKYYAGIAYINLKDFSKGIEYLKEVTTDDQLLETVINGSLGDAYYAQNNTSEALNYFKKAAETSKNDAIAPVYLLKAGKLALALKELETAKTLFTTIKKDFSKSAQAKDIDLYLNQAQ